MTTPALAAFARPGSYNERQVRRFAQLWEINKTREIPQRRRGLGVARGERAPIRSRRPSSTETSGSGTRWSAATTRPGSSPCSTGRWARSAIRAPTSATCSRRTASPAARRTRSARRRSRRFPASRRVPSSWSATSRGSGREVEPLAWFEGLALWKAAVFCEAIYGRYVRGELGAEDTRAARFEQGVPYLAESAAALPEPLTGSSLRRGCEAAAERRVRLAISDRVYSAISASARSASGCCVETSSEVAPDSRHASSRSARRSFGPTSATSSMNASGTAAAASRLFPSR